MADDQTPDTPAGPGGRPPVKRGAKKLPAKRLAARAQSQPDDDARSVKKAAPAKKAAAKKATPAKKATRAKRAPANKAPAKRAAEKKPVPAQATPPTRPAAPAPAPRGMPDPADVPRPWLDAYPPAVPASYDYPEVPLTRLLDDAAKDFPETEAIHFLGYTLTYRQLLDKVDRFASALTALGVRKGDRVGLVLPNCPQHVVAIFAAARIGAVVVENDPLLLDAPLTLQLTDAACKVVVCLDPHYAKLARMKGRLPGVEHIIATGLQDALPFPRNALLPLTGRASGQYAKVPDSDGVLRMSDLIGRTAPTATQVSLAPDDLAALLYAEAPSGARRGVMLTHGNLVANAFQARLWLPDVHAGRENMLCVLPFSSAYGFTIALMVGVLSAATLTILPEFEVGAVLKTIDKRGPTLFPGVPSMFAALVDAPNVKKYDLGSIRACLSGSARLPAEVARAFEALTGSKLREGYGRTEAAPLTHANPVYGKAKPGTIGLPVPDTACVLRDLDDPRRPAEPGAPGELAIAGPQVMAGYWNRPEETAEILIDGWLLTGDVAELDADGYVRLVDRNAIHR